jgi:hypothetical protein
MSTDPQGQRRCLAGGVVKECHGLAQFVDRDGMAGSPGHPSVDGIDQLAQPAELGVLELLEAEIIGRRVREVGEAASFGLDGVELLLGVATLGVYGGDAILGVADPPARDRGLAGGAVAMSEPGVTGIVVGLPHRWTQHGAQLVFDGGDTFGVRPPRSLSGADRRLQIGQFGGGFGAPVRSLGEADGEILAALIELVPVADEPRWRDLVRLRDDSG